MLYVLRTDTRTHVSERNVKEVQRNSLCNCNSTVSPTHFYLIFIHHGGANSFSSKLSTQNGNWWWFKRGLEYSIPLGLVKRHFTKSNALTGPDDQFEHHPFPPILPPSFTTVLYPPPYSPSSLIPSLICLVPLIPSFSFTPSHPPPSPSSNPSSPPALQPSSPPSPHPSSESLCHSPSPLPTTLSPLRPSIRSPNCDLPSPLQY